mgnify:CR=1 FL=1
MRNLRGVVQQYWQAIGVKVNLKRLQRLPEMWADPDQLKEVLVNLLTNACEAMGSGGAIVIREGETFLQSVGQVVTIQVSDNGRGIPPQLRRKIFGRFVRLGSELERDKPGTGLGLYIVRTMVRRLGGSIDDWAGWDAHHDDFPARLSCRYRHLDRRVFTRRRKDRDG